MNHFSDNLKIARKRMGLSQLRLAEACGFKKHCIGAYEEGRSEPNITKLIILSVTLKVSIDELVKGQLLIS